MFHETEAAWLNACLALLLVAVSKSTFTLQGNICYRVMFIKAAPLLIALASNTAYEIGTSCRVRCTAQNPAVKLQQNYLMCCTV